MAVAADGPTHMATDSQAFLDKATKVLQLVVQGKGPQRPWALQQDGDLWAHYHKQLVAKGPLSARLTKVKGHATQAMVDQGLLTATQRAGNHMVDATAEEAVDRQYAIIM